MYLSWVLATVCRVPVPVQRVAKPSFSSSLRNLKPYGTGISLVKCEQVMKYKTGFWYQRAQSADVGVMSPFVHSLQERQTNNFLHAVEKKSKK